MELAAIAKLRSLVKGEIFDYDILLYSLSDYKKPRDKITQWLKNGTIIRIKKGLYVFGPLFQQGPISLEILSSLLVQPSYVSKEYALQHYGLMAERVETVTCMTTRKTKVFHTPLGTFDFQSINRNKFSLGVFAQETSNGGFLLATKEKALADWISSYPMIQDKDTLEFFLYEESRIEKSSLLPLDSALLKEISKIYKNPNVNLLLNL